MAEEYERCQVEGLVADLPVELFDLPDLSEILSLESWNEILTDDDRETLAPYLPDVEGEDLQEALQDLLAGYNINFGNPRDTLFHSLKTGECFPDVADIKKGSLMLQKKQHYHNLRTYHDKLVSRLWQMQKVLKKQKWRPLKEKMKYLKSVKEDTDFQFTEKKSREKENENLPDPKRQANGPDSPVKLEIPPEPDLPDLGPMDKILGFSIVHLLSAIRTAFLKTRGTGLEEFDWLTVEDLVERVQESPGDSRILSSKYKLEDLIIHSLLVLQTKAPPGTRLWKPFVQQKRLPPKDWSWCGTVPYEDEDFAEVHTETEYWGISEKAFTKLRERLVVSVTSTNLDRSLAGGRKASEGQGIANPP